MHNLRSVQSQQDQQLLGELPALVIDPVTVIMGAWPLTQGFEGDNS